MHAMVVKRPLLLVALALACATCVDSGSSSNNNDSSSNGGTSGISNNTAAAPAAPTAPAYVLSTLQVIRTTGRAPAGYRGGTRFFNDGRDGGAALPTATRDGSPIRYQEWDVHPWVRGVNRGAERLITGSDGSAYFTSDHYRTCTRLPP
jgi:guanyl-specific ribonuclease Sa